MSLELQRTLDLTRRAQLFGMCARENGAKPLPSESNLPSAKDLNRILDHYDKMHNDIFLLDQSMVDLDRKPDQAKVSRLTTRFGLLDGMSQFGQSPLLGVSEVRLSALHLDNKPACVVVSQGGDLEAFVRDPQSGATYNLRGSYGGRLFVSSPGNPNLLAGSSLSK
jgi:hypothetical protein